MLPEFLLTYRLRPAAEATGLAFAAAGGGGGGAADDGGAAGGAPATVDAMSQLVYRVHPIPRAARRG